MNLPEGKAGLALGAGAARGWAHIGVIHALEEAGVDVGCVAGASAGALVGAAFAAGRLDTLEELVLHIDIGQVLRYFSDLTFSGAGVVDGARIVETLDEVVGGICIEDFPMPFAAVATDLENAEAVVFREGRASLAVRASISFPGVFTPVEQDGHVLVDGGLVNPVPVNLLREMGADWTIAVDVNHGRTGLQHRRRKREKRHERFKSRFGIREQDVSYRLYKKIESRFEKLRSKTTEQPQLLTVLDDSIKILEARVADALLEQDPPDVLIRPDVGYISFMEFNHAEEAMDEGYQATVEALERFAG